MDIGIEYIWQLGDLAKSLKSAAEFVENLSNDNQFISLTTNYCDEKGWEVTVVYYKK